MMTAKPKILIVDDKPENLYALDLLLKQLDVEVIQALSGAEALSLSVEHEFCVAIVDIQMPEMDGYELVELLRSYENTATLPTIFVSAIFSDEYHHRKCYEAGAVDFMSKPFIPEILLSKIKVFIELYQQRKTVQNFNEDLQELSYQLNERNGSLLKLTDELEDKNTCLEKMTAELQVLNEEKDKFFFIIAHDLRSPFTSFLGSTQFLVQRVDYLSKQDFRDMTQSIHNEAKRVFNLLENLLAWARLQREGGMQCEPEPIELRGLAQETLAVFEQTATQKEITLNNTIAADCRVQADRPMLETVLRNLTANALKFTPRGGQITLAARSGGVDNQPGLVQVSVQDTGVGMSEADRAKLFRIDAQHTTLGTENERGSGLGLTICKEMVERNGGQIWVESEPGQGTTVEFTVPLAVQSPA